jgi:hypothetical protein
MHRSDRMRSSILAILSLLAACKSGGGGQAPDARADAAVTDGAVTDASPVDAPEARGLRLVSARDHIEGAFLIEGAVAADATRIYLASRWDPTLFVLARDRAANFPVLERVTIPAQARLISVHVDAARVYVVTDSREVHVFRKEATLVAESLQSLTPGQFASHAAWHDGSVLVSDGTSSVAADDAYAWVWPLNEDDAATEYTVPGFVRGTTYAPPFDRTKVHRFDRATGIRIGTLPAPVDVFGRLAAVSMELDGDTIALLTPGCCGAGVFFHEAVTLRPRTLIPHRYANALARSGGYLVIGDEAGAVALWDVSRPNPVQIARVDLREETGHTAPEAIEIRALWTDAHDRLIFAGSSWGNDQIRGPALPSFFVLERTGP